MAERGSAMTSDVLGQLAELRTSIKRIEDEILSAGRPLPGGTSAVAVAKALYAARRLRGHFLPARLFADPAWDILLDLYLARAEGRRVHTSSACHSARVPPTTGLRWLEKMEKEGVIVRHGASDDLRRVYIELTAPTFAAMTRLLDRIRKDAPRLE